MLTEKQCIVVAKNSKNESFCLVQILLDFIKSLDQPSNVFSY